MSEFYLALTIYIVISLTLLGVISDLQYSDKFKVGFIEFDTWCIDLLVFPYGMYRGIRFDLR